MADNVELNVGSGGAILAADEVTVGVYHQRVKVQHGADGSATDVSDASPLPVEIGDGTDQVLVSAAGALQVDVASALPAGTNNIGDVDVLSFPSTVHSADFDTGAGTDTTLAFGIAVPASGGAAVVPGDTSNGLDVDVTRVSGTVTVDGSGVTQPISHAALTELAGAIDTEVQCDIVGPLPAGTNLIGDVGLQPRASGGVSSVYLDSDVDNTAAAVKASAGQVYWVHVMNLDTAVVYLYLYDIAAASVTVGTSTPKYRIPIPTQAASANGAGALLSFPHGLEFGTAISVAASATLNTNDDPGANVVHVAIGYE